MADKERTDETENSGTEFADAVTDESLEQVVGGVASDPGAPGTDQWDDYWDSYEGSGGYGE